MTRQLKLFTRTEIDIIKVSRKGPIKLRFISPSRVRDKLVVHLEDGDGAMFYRTVESSSILSYLESKNIDI